MTKLQRRRSATRSVTKTAAPRAKAAGPARLTPFAGGWEAHKDRRCIWIVTPNNYPHSHAFDEVALAMQGAWQELGGSLPIVTEFKDFAGRSPIIYGGNLLPEEIIPHLPADSVIINLEQVSDDSVWINARYLTVLRNFPVLDYSARNRDRLTEKGIVHAGLLEIGYSPCLTRIAPAPVKDIDILFYGSLNKRRADILRALQIAGLNVIHLFSVYGEQRDAAIARAKVVMNIHQFDSKVFEIVRVSYLLANHVCVLTEGDPADPDVKPLIEGLAVEPYETLIGRAIMLVASEEDRRALAQNGFDIISRQSQAEKLKSVMDAGAASPG
ncbi:hypothetical protein ACQKKX_17325 [Neorhizobium sp. NPDC001467]|uniref:hypothetical protein n=1 Tax=Neorhizobium sp. NPDC001467 TaxID=3390595 RepID=UPI003D061DC7